MDIAIFRLFKPGKQPPATTTVYTIRGSVKPDDVARQVSAITTLLNVAERKEQYVAEYRQRLFNLALLIFAAVIAFSTRSEAGPFRSLASVALFVLMVVFSCMDRHFHKCIHGWRETEWERTDALMSLVDKPGGDLRIPVYCGEGEATAEPWSLQPLITYLLIFGSLINLAVTFWARLAELFVAFWTHLAELL